MKDYSIDVSRKGNKITLEPSRSTQDYGDVYHSSDLFMNDLYILYSQEDGWSYLIDQSTGEVGQFDGYWGSYVRDLIEGKTVVVTMESKDSDNYKDYDFNI